MKYPIPIAVMLFVLVFAGSAQAQVFCEADGLDVTAEDSYRLETMLASRQNGLVGALRSESQADREIVADLFKEGLAVPSPDDLYGKYQCRTIKMGGLLPLTIYDWFKCEINQEDATYTIRKVTGSQNFFGILKRQSNGFAYRGARYYGYEDDIPFYGDNVERNQVGCLSAVSPGTQHFVLELPMPLVESVYDIIELKPVQ